jgi:single-strand DNA-binding protein
MNSLKNNVRLIGHLGQAPDVKNLEGGSTVTKFSVATNESYTDKKGEKQTNTEWHNLVAWGKTAELAGQLLQKGSEVAIEGRLTSHSYEKNGEKKYVTEVVVNEFMLLGKKAS